MLVHDPSITTVVFQVFDEDFKFGSMIGGDDLIGSCEVACKTLAQDQKDQDHALPLELADGVEDEQIRQLGEATLRVRTRYIPLVPVRSEDDDEDVLFDESVDDAVVLGRRQEAKAGASGAAAAPVRGQSIGVLSVRAIKTESITTGSSDSKQDSIFVKIEVENEDRYTSKKKNTAEQTWLDAYFFVRCICKRRSPFVCDFYL